MRNMHSKNHNIGRVSCTGNRTPMPGIVHWKPAINNNLHAPKPTHLPNPNSTLTYPNHSPNP